MRILQHLYFYKLFRHLYLVCVLVFFSCESEPIVFNPSNGYEYLQKSFFLNNEISGSMQGDLHTGLSEKIYTGIISSLDSASIYLHMLPDILDSHEVCYAQSINDVSFILNASNPILLKQDSTMIDTLIDFNSLKAYIAVSNLPLEDIVLTQDIVDDKINQYNEDDPLAITLLENSIKIDLLSNDGSIISKWCEEKEKIALIIKYTPKDSSYIEFYSSDHAISDLSPQLYLEYNVQEQLNRIYNRYSITGVNWSDLLALDQGPYYVMDSTYASWGTFYLMNLNDPNQIISNPPLDYSSISINSNVISTGQSLELMTISLELNSLIVDEIDSVNFSIINTFAFRSDEDPHLDNYEFNPDSSENNLKYDIGELFNDFGLDGCPDSLETGISANPCDSDLSAYNLGKEGNGFRDWLDKNNNGLWDLGEGEEWGDWGYDWCPDSLEGGGGICLTSPSVDPLGYDPNKDNIDPTGDDWHSLKNLNGTEGNNIWDIGESYYDWGTDGLPVSIIGNLDSNGSENNGFYDVGEVFDDTGIDGLFNKNEVGYGESSKEGNGLFDGDGEFNDFGLDNICGGCNGDVDTDDYNIDPNLDNWLDCGSDGICDYLSSDFDGTEANQIWDDNEGTENNGLLDIGAELSEEWFDWGIDGIHDSLEAFQASSVIPITVVDNNYTIDLEEIEQTFIPEIVNEDSIYLWISKITRDDSLLTINVSAQSNVNLKGFQFQLNHAPYSRKDTFLLDKASYLKNADNEKIFEDLTLIPKKNHSVDELDGKLLVDYSNDIFASLNFDSLQAFIENEEYIFSHQYSNLVFKVDQDISKIDKNGMQISIVHRSDDSSDQILATKMIFPSTDSVEVHIGQILRAFQAETIDSYNGFKIISGSSNLYNYSKLYILDNPRIDIMYTQ